MRVQGDIVTDDNGDIVIADGDILVADCTPLHTRDILRTHRGEYKQHPTIGAGIENFTDDESSEDMLRTIRKELIKDGQKVQTLRYNETNGQLQINSWYE